MLSASVKSLSVGEDVTATLEVACAVVETPLEKVPVGELCVLVGILAVIVVTSIDDIVVVGAFVEACCV